MQIKEAILHSFIPLRKQVVAEEFQGTFRPLAGRRLQCRFDMGQHMQCQILLGLPKLFWDFVWTLQREFLQGFYGFLIASKVLSVETHRFKLYIIIPKMDKRYGLVT